MPAPPTARNRFPIPKKDRAEATTDGVIKLPRRSISTAAVWETYRYNYQWNTLATGTAPHTSYADRASPYGTLTPLNDVADASFPTRLGIPLGRIMDFGTVTPAPAHSACRRSSPPRIKQIAKSRLIPLPINQTGDSSCAFRKSSKRSRSALSSNSPTGNRNRPPGLQRNSLHGHTRQRRRATCKNARTIW